MRNMCRFIIWALIAAALSSHLVAAGSRNSSIPVASCVLPPYPGHGTYSVEGWLNASLGMKFAAMTVTVTCDAPMRPLGPVEMRCSNGKWSVDKFTGCSSFCKVPHSHSTTYFCGDSYDKKCEDYVPDRTSIRPKCNKYYYTVQPNMDSTCFYDRWNFVDDCDRVDVRLSKKGSNLTVNLGGELVLRLTGSQYNVRVDLNSKTVLERTVPEPQVPLFEDYD